MSYTSKMRRVLCSLVLLSQSDLCLILIGVVSNHTQSFVVAHMLIAHTCGRRLHLNCLVTMEVQPLDTQLIGHTAFTLAFP